MRVAVLLLMLDGVGGPSMGQSPVVDFRRDVVPILEAHCFDCHRGRDASASYRLDLKSEILGQTTGRPLVKAGDAANSRLIHVVEGKIPNKIMPRKGPRLTQRQVDLLRAWIDQGLAWDDKLFPADEPSDHWAFQPLRAIALPKVKNADWIATPVDAFIAAAHEERGLTPSPPAPPRAILRRLTLDLTGLPPTGEDGDMFVAAHAVDSERTIRETVDRLLASPHYGERWGRHWLDVVRFAESEGYESNHPRPAAWRYRDWVVAALNRDLPFNDFIRQQLAGDEIVPYADEHLIATGFLAAARLSSNEEDRLRQRNDYHVDIVNTTASALLGLTMQCAQCHNHKFDPITARDYYRFMGYFVKGQPANVALRDPDLWAAYNAKKPKGYDEALRERDDLFAQAKERKFAEVRKSFTAEQSHALDLPREQRSPEQDRLAREADLRLQFTIAQFEKMLTAEEKKRYDVAKTLVADLEKTMPDKPHAFGYYSPVTSPHALDVLPMKGFYPLEMVPKELAKARAFLFEAGDVHKPAFAVSAGWPAVFSGKSQPTGESRLALAEWIVSQPLTARVYVNRIWQHHFGRGLVAIANDFGVKGERPTHPELLDWLAAELTRTGSTKHIHRLIVLSNAYRQAAVAQPKNVAIDGDNRYLWRWTSRRLEAEAIRDSWLAVSGELARGIGGASGDEQSVRRSVYLLQKREAPPQHQALFDGPIAMTESCAKRQTTTVALQPLFLLNSRFSMERATALAKRVAAASEDRERQIVATYRLVLAREPDADEISAGRRFFERVNGEAALARYCQAILNLNEFANLE